jgi:hypothetical protein
LHWRLPRVIGPHTQADHAGILLWEIDWRIERENILEEMTQQS